MPRLTRTQKYADLRDQLANNQEEKITSSDLNPYQNRLNNVQDTLSFSNQNSAQNFSNIEEPKYNYKPLENNAFSQPTAPVNKPVVEQPKQNNSFFNSFVGEPTIQKQNNDFKSYFEDENTNKDVFGDVSDDSGEIISRKERDTYLNQTLTDVFSYNKQSGEDTINTILDNSVNEVRHSEKNYPIDDAESIEVVNNEVKNETLSDLATNNAYWQPLEDNFELDADAIEEQKINDEEFSNTVSMEITKIMDELGNVPEVNEKPVQKENNVETPVQINEQLPEEKPEEVVEIKNIAEVEKEEKERETMSNTIPFIVNTDEEELEEEDDEEEDGSNTVLNVILIVLIVVLVAVLGLIVFYILKTKGIF